jgi:hypothetical protein
LDIENLHKGQLIKNYKELCKIINEDIKSGNSKKSQLHELSQYCKYHKNGNAFYIDEVYKCKKFIRAKNEVDYIKIIELLLLNILCQQKGKVFISRNKIYKTFKMINTNYIEYSQKQDQLSAATDIDRFNINEFYNSTNSTLHRNINKALDNLKKQALILWNEEIAVCQLYVKNIDNFSIEKDIVMDENGDEDISYTAKTKMRYKHREASEDEKRFILKLEREYITSHGFEGYQDIVAHGLWKKFKDSINQQLLKKYQIAFYYNCYNIIFNEDQILEGYVDILKKILKSDINNKSELLNKKVAERLLYNINNKYLKAKKDSQDNKKKTIHKQDTIERRLSDTYLNDNKELIKLLIDYKTEPIVLPTNKGN